MNDTKAEILFQKRVLEQPEPPRIVLRGSPQGTTKGVAGLDRDGGDKAHRKVLLAGLQYDWYTQIDQRIHGVLQTIVKEKSISMRVDQRLYKTSSSTSSKRRIDAGTLSSRLRAHCFVVTDSLSHGFSFTTGCNLSAADRGVKHNTSPQAHILRVYRVQRKFASTCTAQHHGVLGGGSVRCGVRLFFCSCHGRRKVATRQL